MKIVRSVLYTFHFTSTELDSSNTEIRNTFLNAGFSQDVIGALFNALCQPSEETPFLLEVSLDEPRDPGAAHTMNRELKELLIKEALLHDFSFGYRKGNGYYVSLMVKD